MNLYEFKIELKIKNEEKVYTINWSPWIEIEKFRILTTVPSEAGILQLFEVKNGHLFLVDTRMVYYGGIRHLFLELLDPDSARYDPFKHLLLTTEMFCRFSLTTSVQTLNDAIKILKGNRNYSDIAFLIEKDSMGIIRAIRDPEYIKPLR